MILHLRYHQLIPPRRKEGTAAAREQKSLEATDFFYITAQGGENSNSFSSALLLLSDFAALLPKNLDLIYYRDPGAPGSLSKTVLDLEVHHIPSGEPHD